MIDILNNVDTTPYLQYLFGAATTWSGVFIKYYLDNKSNKEKEEKTKKALRLVLVSLLHSFERHIQSGNPSIWDNLVWQKNQITLSQYFPEETYTFALYVDEFNSGLHNSYINRELVAAAVRDIAKQLQ